MNKNFNRRQFYPIKSIFKIDFLEKLLESNLIYSNFSDNIIIEDISSLSVIRPHSFIFLEDIITNRGFDDNVHVITNLSQNKNYFTNISIVKNLSAAYNKILNTLFYHDDQSDFPDEYIYSNGSHISKYSKVHSSSEIGINSVISRGVEIGENCIIKNNVVIKNSILGNNVIISDNSSIGTSGFGFDFNKRGSLYLNPQIGTVIIDDNVHIGSSCTIDRARIDCTFVGKNSMIDNMVHIAHNVIIGKNACIAAQTGISGSVVIGDNVTIGGQVGFAGHINIGENVVVAAKSGVTKNLNDNSIVAGFPAIDIKEWKKNIIKQRKHGH